MSALARIAGGALLALAAALPARAESLADTMVAAYRHSALIEQNRAVLRALADPATVARLREFGADPWPLGPTDYQAFMLGEERKWGPVVRAAGVTVN